MIALALLFAAQIQVAVDAGELSAPLAEMIALDRPDLTFTASTSTAAARVIVAQRDQLLEVAIYAEDRPVTSRTIVIEGGRIEPALRVAALLAVETLPRRIEAPPLEPPRRPPPPPLVIAPPGPVKPKLLFVSVALTGAYWSSPSSFRPGLSISAAYAVHERLLLGLKASSAGLACCDLDVPDFDAHGRDVTFAVSARLVLFGGVGVATSAGGTFVWYSGLPAYANSVRQSKSGIEGDLRIGVLYETPPIAGDTALYAFLGARARFARVILFAERFQGGRTEVDPGLLTPLAEIGASFSVF